MIRKKDTDKDMDNNNDKKDNMDKNKKWYK